MMKQLLVCSFIFSLLLYSVLAIDANIYEAGNFNKHPEQMVVLEERDMIRINWNDKTHQIHVRKVYYPEKKKVDLTAFIEGSEVPYYTTINHKTSLQLDFDKDDEFDLKISVFKFLEEGGKKFVALKLEKLKKELSQEVTTRTIVDPKDNKLSLIQDKIYLLAGFVILILGVWKRRLFLKTYRKIKSHK